MRFVVFDSAGPATDWTIRHAYLLGPDGVPTQGDIAFDRDTHSISCTKRTPESIALAVQYPPPSPTPSQTPANSPDQTDPPAMGPLVLQTCLLPEREHPYLLTLELARHRLMQHLNKLEDWALFDLPLDHPIPTLFNKAREAFTNAVVEAGDGSDPYTLQADTHARTSLNLALHAGEALAAEQARRLYAKRATGELVKIARSMGTPDNALTDHETTVSRNAMLGSVGTILTTPPTVGACINPDQFTPSLTRIAQASCDFIRLPMRWVDMEPTEGRYVFTKTDRWIEWAVRQAKLPVAAGPVIDFRPRCVPEWLYIWENDYETLRELIVEHLKTIVTRYRRTVTTWTVASGLHVNSNFRFSFDQLMDLTRLCVTLVRRLQPNATIQVEIDQPWGEYFSRNARSVPPTLYAEMIAQAAIDIDQLALRIEMGLPEPGRATRDTMELSSLLDRYAQLNLPIALSAVSAPSAAPDPDTLGVDAEMHPGHWTANWSEQAQCDWLTRVAAIASAKPYITGLCWHELCDPSTPKDLRNDGLISATGKPKAALSRVAEIKRTLNAKQQLLDLPQSPAADALFAAPPSPTTTRAGQHASARSPAT